ncbi:MAG: HNH endonuclease [Opitutales bacterium]|nr:HNH endonuclease [Opitutales bacterium]
MSWHTFKESEEYLVTEIVETLLEDMESGRVEDVKGKMPLIELFEKERNTSAIYTPFGSAWGSSPYNPNVWKRKNGEDLITGYRKPRSRKPFTAKTRKEVSYKTDGHCYSCGYKFKELSEIWIEHIIPFSLGGSDDIQNLLPGCRICNYTRQNFTPHQIQRMLSIGSILVREIDKQSKLGNDVLGFLKAEDQRREKNRKHKDQSFLVYESKPSTANKACEEIS